MCTCIGLTCCLRAHMKSVFTEIQHAAQCARALAEILGGPSGQFLDELAAERIPARHHALAGAEEDVLGRSLHFNAAGNARGAACSCRHFDPVQADRGGGFSSAGGRCSCGGATAAGKGLTGRLGQLILNKTENEKQEQVRFASCPRAFSFCSYLVSQTWNLVESNCSATS